MPNNFTCQMGAPLGMNAGLIWFPPGELFGIVKYFLFLLWLTETQFDRCLDQLFGIVLTPDDDAKLMEKYGSPDPKRRGMVSYRKFCEVIGAGNLSTFSLFISLIVNP